MLILITFATLTIASVAVITIPVWIGRLAMGLWLTSPSEPVHELYTSACGLYLSWVIIRAAILIGTWLPRGYKVILDTVRRWSITVNKLTSFKIIQNFLKIYIIINISIII